MDNKGYWKKRFAALEDMQYQKSKEYIQDVEKQFRAASFKIQQDIEKWYYRLADNNGISYAAAKKLLKADSLAEFKWDVDTYIKYGRENNINGKWVKELENASAKVHINYLQAMKIQVQQEAEKLYQEFHGGMEGFVKNSYKDSFYKCAFEVAKGTGVGHNLAALDERRIEKVIKKPWARDGINFSSRIWNNKNRLVETLHTELTQCIIRGQNPDEGAKALAKKMDVNLSQARRLVYTESAAVAAAAQKDCFNMLGVEEYQVVATLDSHTSKICRDMDGKHFPMPDYQPGTTAPPFHCNCRSTTCPYFDDEFTKGEKRAERGADGKTSYVPADMTYKQWQQKFVDNGTDNTTTGNDASADFLIRSHTPGQNTFKERQSVNEALADMPLKVQKALQNTVIDVGKDGACQYDYNNDILYVAKGANKTAVIHEIGHMAENKLLDAGRVSKIREEVTKGIRLWDITEEIYEDQQGNEVIIYAAKSDKFISEYQGRVYVDKRKDAFDEKGNLKSDLLWEFCSEPFRLYFEDPDDLKTKCPEMYELIKEAVE